jgi:hypothetical protein
MSLVDLLAPAFLAVFLGTAALYCLAGAQTVCGYAGRILHDAYPAVAGYLLVSTVYVGIYVAAWLAPVVAPYLCHGACSIGALPMRIFIVVVDTTPPELAVKLFDYFAFLIIMLITEVAVTFLVVGVHMLLLWARRATTPHLCIACVTTPRDTCVYPCKHIAYCQTCADVALAANRACPLCRAFVTRYDRVYF